MNSNKINILHITPHLGGGVGSVVLNYIKNDTNFNHKVVCLDYINDNAVEVAKSIDLEVYGDLSKDVSKVLSLIKEADIVLVHFWNHPLLYDFLIRNDLPPSRVVFWSHTSGICPPHNFTDKVLLYPDLFVFNTALAFENPEVQFLPDENKQNFKVIWATGGIDKFKNIKPKKKDSFNIGYIGTVDYCRLHENFLNLCAKVKIEDAKFIVCGGLKEKEIALQAQKMGIDEKFKFTGKINDAKEYLELFDVFAYPLTSGHSGTCDLVLQEAMASGVVPVVFDNPMEKSMVIDGVTGIIVKTEEEYVSAIEELYKNEDLREKLAGQAREYAVKNFSLEALVNKWKDVFDEIILLPKTSKKWMREKSSDEMEHKDIFLEALGEYAQPFKLYLESDTKEEGINQIKNLAKQQIWQGESKSTVHQYYNFFKNDKTLENWSKIMKKEESLAKGNKENE